MNLLRASLSMATQSPQEHIESIRAEFGLANDGTIVNNRAFRTLERSLSM